MAFELLTYSENALEISREQIKEELKVQIKEELKEELKKEEFFQFKRLIVSNILFKNPSFLEASRLTGLGLNAISDIAKTL